MSNGDTVHFYKQLLNSKAYFKLNGASIKVLNSFYMKRQMQKLSKSSGRTQGWNIKNNGEIVFTRDEAKKKGFRESTFKRAIDSLINYGFIDLSHQGTGLKGDCNKYAISKRWKLYGTPEFVVRVRQKQLRDTAALQIGRQNKINGQL